MVILIQILTFSLILDEKSLLKGSFWFSVAMFNFSFDLVSRIILSVKI